MSSIKRCVEVVTCSQERVVGCSWLCDVRLRFSERWQYDTVFNIMSNLFGEVAPLSRDDDDTMINACWMAVRIESKMSWFRPRHIVIIRHLEMFDKLKAELKGTLNI